MKSIRITALAILCISVPMILSSCASSEESMQTYIPTFSWSPESKEPANSAGMTMAIVVPVYGTGQVWAIQQAFDGFSRSLDIDFQNLLTSKGFTIEGPFDSYDAMTYEEKESCELAMYPALSVSVQFSSVNWVEDLGSSLVGGMLSGPNSANHYKLHGDIVVGGKVTLIALEPLTNQKMWVKDINLPDTTIHVVSQDEYLGYGIGQPVVQLVGVEVPRSFFNDPGIEVPVAKTLEVYYDKILNTASRYIDVREMHGLEKQVKEIRAKARFINQ